MTIVIEKDDLMLRQYCRLKAEMTEVGNGDRNER
jgi:hypothetical protein